MTLTPFLMRGVIFLSSYETFMPETLDIFYEI